MTFRDWLPVEVVNRPAIREALQRSVRTWSDRWFAPSRFGLGDSRPVPGVDAVRLVERRDGTWRRRDGVAVDASGRAVEWLVNSALALSSEALPTTPFEKAVLAEFEQRLFDDLLQELGRDLEIAPPGNGSVDGRRLFSDGALEATVTDGEGGAYLTLLIAKRVIMPRCRGSLPESRASRAPLGSVRNAIGPLPVLMDPVLGESEIGLEDLMHLAVGDVLILDTRLDRGVSLLTAGSNTLVSHAQVSSSANRITLELQP